MKHDGYSYAVEAEVTFTGRDLEVMRTCAEDHYDFDCQSFFKAGNRGYGWVNQFIFHNERKAPVDCPEGTLTVTERFRVFDLICKILEQGRWYPEVAAEADALSDDLRSVLQKINQEVVRLNPGKY